MAADELSPNVAAFKQGMAALSAFDTATACAITDPNVEMVTLRSAVEGAYRGHDGLTEFVADTRRTFDVFELSYTEFRELGDGRLLAAGTIRVRGHGSGIDTEIPTAGIATFRDGLILHWHDYGERSAALAAAGLSD